MIEIHRPDRRRLRRIAWTKAHFVDNDLATGNADCQLVATLILVQRSRTRRQRMRHIAHILSVAQSNAIGKIVENHSVAVAIVANVCRQQSRIAPTNQLLCALPGLPPRNRQRELFALHHARGNQHPFAQLSEECQITVRVSAVAEQRRISELQAASRGRSRHQRIGRRVGAPSPAMLARRLRFALRAYARARTNSQRANGQHHCQ